MGLTTTKPVYVTINGKRWVVEEQPLRKNWGETVFDDRKIRMTTRLTPRAKAIVLLHEGIHASYSFLTEDSVLSGEKNLVGLLDAYHLLPSDTEEEE